MSGNAQWGVIHVVVTLIGILFWPWVFIGAGKSTIFLVAYVVFSAVITSLVTDGTITLPKIFNKEK